MAILNYYLSFKLYLTFYLDRLGQMESSKSSVIILNEDEDDEQAVNMEKSWVDLSSPTIPPFVARDRSKDSRFV